MKIQNAGFAFLILGLILVIWDVSFSGAIGVILGINGLILVVKGLKDR